MNGNIKRMNAKVMKFVLSSFLFCSACMIEHSAYAEKIKNHCIEEGSLIKSAMEWFPHVKAEYERIEKEDSVDGEHSCNEYYPVFIEMHGRMYCNQFCGSKEDDKECTGNVNKLEGDDKIREKMCS